MDQKLDRLQARLHEAGSLIEKPLFQGHFKLKTYNKQTNKQHLIVWL